MNSGDSRPNYIKKILRLSRLDTRFNRVTGTYDNTEDILHVEPKQKMVVQRVQESVIDEDNRIRITNTTTYPWNCLCALRITAIDGRRWIGTGWLAGARTVITAGHCVFIHDHGGWAESIEVIPACDGSYRPYGSCITFSSNFSSIAGWVERRNDFSDYGAITLPENYSYGNQLGFLNYIDLDESLLENLTCTVSGYPADKTPLLSQWSDQWRVEAITDRTINYNIDTAGGQSGAPVWFVNSGKPYVIGIHTTGSIAGNSAVRITGPIYNTINNWVSEAA